MCSGRLLRPCQPGLQLESELGRNDHVVADRRQCLAEERFVCIGTIGLGGVEERDAAVHDRTTESDHVRLVLTDSIRGAHPHGSKTKGRDLEGVS